MTIDLKDDEIFLTVKEVSKMTGYAENTLNMYRYNKTGIPFIKIYHSKRHSIRYRKSDVLGWINKNKTLDN